jgi:probable rRNA maturation factor
MLAINNLTDNREKIDENFLKKVAKKILVGEKISVKTNLSIAIVSEGEIKKLNKRYRGINRSTDVLSFGKFEIKREEDDFSEPEVIICPEEVRKNSKLSKEPFEKELARVLIHALLHLNGFEHEEGGEKEKKMFERQEKYLASFRFSAQKINNK